MRRIFFLITTMLCILSCQKCKEKCDDKTNPDCPNYEPTSTIDPCAAITQTNAEFKMYQRMLRMNGTDTLIEFYSECLSGGLITLSAIQEDVTYHWIIGADHYYTKEVSFSFGQEFVGQTIPLILTVSKIPNTTCFPNDDGEDTITKVITPKFTCEASIYGKYYGAWEDNPLDSFTFEISFQDDGASNCGELLIIGAKPNFPDTCFNGNETILDNYIVFDENATSCYSPSGFAKLDSTLNSVVISYWININNVLNEPREFHIFHGHQID